MGKIISTTEVKRIELDILEYVKKKCEKYGLTYFLSYGTLLGAIRHKGFIPWDDDIDICMPREDYEQFLLLMKQEGKQRYKLLIPNVDGYYYEFAKVVDKRTVVKEKGVIQGKDMGIWIDIFPLDGVPKCYKMNRLIMNFFVYCRVASVYTVMPPVPCKILYPLFFLFWKFTRVCGWHFFLNLINNKAIQYKYKDASRVTCLIDPDSNKCFFPKEMFQQLKPIEFEGKYYLAPVEYDKYLVGLYGNYMQIPPVEQRVGHAFVAYWK